MRDNLTDRLRFAVMSFTVCEQLKLNNLLNAHADLNERRFCRDFFGNEIFLV